MAKAPSIPVTVEIKHLVVPGSSTGQEIAWDNTSTNVGAEIANFQVIPPEPSGTRFTTLLAIEDVRVTDGRKIMAGAMFTRQPPLPLMFINRNTGAHDDAVFVGNILRIWREGNEIWGEGVFDDGTPEGREAIRLVGQGRMNGISIDTAVIDHDLVVEEKEGVEYVVGIDIKSMELLGATIVPFPAFEGTWIALKEDDERELVASALPQTFRVADIPKAFDMPEPNEFTPWTVDGDRVYGHLAIWGTCHVGIQDSCVVAPPSQTDYSRFLIGKLEGRRVGVVTMNTIHAPGGLNRIQTERHYADTGTVIAYVNIHDGEVGPWVTGVLDDDISDADRRRLAACGISGDWRKDPMTGELELISILAVPTPGFSVPRTEDEAMLVASAMNHCVPCSEAGENEMTFNGDESATEEAVEEVAEDSEAVVEGVEEAVVEPEVSDDEATDDATADAAAEEAAAAEALETAIASAVDDALERATDDRLKALVDAAG